MRVTYIGSLYTAIEDDLNNADSRTNSPFIENVECGEPAMTEDVVVWEQRLSKKTLTA